MSKLQGPDFELLKLRLTKDFVPKLPAIAGHLRSQEDQDLKNLSRAFSAFALSKLCNITSSLASESVVDDFDDKGIDAIYYHPYDETLYLVQSKLKTSEQFGQDEALAFCQGVRKLLRQDLDDFNQHVQRRRKEIEEAIEECSCIKLVIAYVSDGISSHGLSAISDLYRTEVLTDERLVQPLIKFDSHQVNEALLEAKAYQLIDEDLRLQNCTSVNTPKLTYFGLIPLQDLVSLHNKHQIGLYEKNIRTFLGQKTDVNIAIRNTLLSRPEDFLYLHNGVAALCQEINPKHTSNNKKKIQIKGLSVINGAQTIASAAQFVEDNPSADITSAHVLITLIQSSSDSEFGKDVTKARNHQNSVASYNFAALDDKQERLRRQLAYLNYTYIYKAGVHDGGNDITQIFINEAVQALALFAIDPRLTVQLKREPNSLLNVDSEQYKSIFEGLTAQELINAVLYYRYIQNRVFAEVKSATSSQERLIYKHGAFAIGWIIAQRVREQQKNHSIMNKDKIEVILSVPFDELRQIFLEEALDRIIVKGPLAFFKSQADVIPLLQAVTTKYYRLTGDVVLKNKPQLSNQPYPVDLFKYIIKRAPQISDLT